MVPVSSREIEYFGERFRRHFDAVAFLLPLAFGEVEIRLLVFSSVQAMPDRLARYSVHTHQTIESSTTISAGIRIKIKIKHPSKRKEAFLADPGGRP